MKVRMYPHLQDLDSFSSGIAQVIKNYFEYLPQYGIDLVGPRATSYDIEASHAAAYVGAQVTHSHGLLWTDMYKLSDASWHTNASLVQAAREALEITVPSNWVAETFRRDMRINPQVIPHGVDWEAWQHDRDNAGYVLWAKNRTSDGLIPEAVNDLALALPNVEFVTTFGSGRRPSNVKILGSAIPHEQMRVLIQQAAVVLATDKETWGILPAEAMAAGVPILSVNSGAVPDFMPHGIAGYTFEPGNLDDAVRGLQYCLRYRDQLGANGREIIKEYSWERAAAAVAEVYQRAYKKYIGRELQPSVDVIIPCHNYGHKLGGAIRSALEQSYPVQRVIIVDDASTDDTREVAQRWVEEESQSGRVVYIRCEVRNVAKARNIGIDHSTSKYVIPLDADDRIGPRFVEVLVDAAGEDDTLGIAYTGARVELSDGTEILPHDWQGPISDGQLRSKHIWPKEYSYDEHLGGRNQIPTCCLIRRDALRKVGGYRARYAPEGAGSEDAELFTRIPSIGYGATYVPSQPDALFIHTHGEGNVSGSEDYAEVNWLAWHPWVKDGRHPFASVATPANEKPSHPVRFYDQPAVSVIIPVGPGHEEVLVNALDSLEAQTFRNWEVIVVWDSPEMLPRWLDEGGAYPYVVENATWTGAAEGYKSKGAGHARNQGVRAARAPLVAFLDADDYYHPDFLQKALETFWETRQVVYTDFVSRMTPDQYKRYGGEIVRQFKNRNEVMVFDRFNDYDCEQARIRPNGIRPYVWSGVTVLLPKLWHEEIGGFDESMETWEDCDYLLRLAWNGYCFTHIKEPLWVYDFTSGVRRDRHVGNEEEIVSYLRDKYDRIGAENMGCDCESTKREDIEPVSESDRLAVLYAHPNRGKHYVYGPATRERYGRYSGGTVIPNVAKVDVRARPQHFLCPNCQESFVVTKDDVYCKNCNRVSDVIRHGRPTDIDVVADPQSLPPPQPVEALPTAKEQVEELEEEIDDKLQGEPKLHAGMKIADIDFGRTVNSRHCELLEVSGIITLDDAERAGHEGMTLIHGIGDKVASAILDKAGDRLEL